MNSFSLSLDHAQLSRLFPYFILLDSDMKILHIGDKLKNIYAGCENGNLFDYFELSEFNGKGQLPLGETFLISPKHTGGKIKGSWEKSAEQELLFFAGADYIENGLGTINGKNNATADALPLPNTHHFDRILGNMGFGFIEMDAAGRIKYANKRFCTLSGYAIDSMYQQMPDVLFSNDFFAADYTDEDSEETDAELHEIVFTDAQGNQRLWLAGRAVNYNEKNENTGWTSICFDVSEHKSFEQELITAKKDAERTATIKAMFLANMSHEIRTPMNAIISMANLLSKTTLTEEQDYYIQTVQTASKSLLVIIDDILDLSKIDAGKLNLEHIGFSLPMVFNEVMQVVTHKAVKRGLEINYLPPADIEISSVLIGDPYRITQVVLNLMTNAIKFTEKGSVLLTAIVREDSEAYQEIEVLVKDTGIGMDPEFLSRLFDNFSQEYESVTRKYGGTGLGMSISQKLVAQMGGYFNVKSEKGQGSEISFVIKLEKGKTTDVPAETKVTHNEDLFAGRKILIVDDNEMNRLVASTVLLGYGPQVMIAENGEIALKMLNEEAYDIILMDIQMPVLNGYDTTKALRAGGYTGVIIALTASAIEGEREKCLAAGMDDYITKPINEELLIGVIDNWIQKTATPVTAPDIDLPLYNLDGLRVISKGREDFVTKMIEMFCGQIPDTLKQLNQVSADGDHEQLSKLAHKLKSTIDHLAISPLQRTIREIEAVDEGNIPAPKLAEMIAEVNDVLNRVLAELSEEIAIRNSQ
ncbi:ATP-binding protein [Pedobacter ghigonis]|uniref:ATP-binding protein n=1 Tax=Pedobacter ghigonis TaxID=2730403 RepID=UPI00158E13D7|nr:ATP-binding protein [Pedobacter ghigonis]